MNWFLVFVGGGVGSLLRYGLARQLPVVDYPSGGWPWATLLANGLACLLLGVAGALLARGVLPKEAGWLLVSGLCGGFSTFSTFSGELYALVEAGYWGVASAYLLVSIVVGVLSIGLATYLLRG